jgi:hypothetical protein
MGTTSKCVIAMETQRAYEVIEAVIVVNRTKQRVVLMAIGRG